MSNKEVKQKYSDAELLGYAMWDLNSAMEHVMEIESEYSDILFHMIHSIMFYIEEYLNKECDLVKAARFKDLVNINKGK